MKRGKNENIMKALILYVLMTLVPVVISIGKMNPEQKSKARVRVVLDYYKTPGMEYLTVKVSGRLDKRYEPVGGMEVSFFLTEESEFGMLGKIITGLDGTATFELPRKYYQLSDTLDILEFIAVLKPNPVFQDKVTTLTIKKVDLDIDYFNQDSLKWVTARVLEKDITGVVIPQEKVGIRFLVDRPLGELPLSEEYISTDSKGFASVNFPNDLPGDFEGNVKIIVRIDDHDDYGTIEEYGILRWGIPTLIHDETIVRSLWASGANAPFLLLLLVNGLILGVWGILLYILYEIYIISRLGEKRRMKYLEK